MSLPELIQSWLSGLNVGAETGGLLARVMLAAAALLVSLITFFVSRRIVSGGVHLVFKRSRFLWDDYLMVFKDPILGFVAGIQLISNRMLKNGDWIEMPNFEAIQSDIFDHLLAIVPEFGLKVYQYPSGSDVEKLVPAAGR